MRNIPKKHSERIAELIKKYETPEPIDTTQKPSWLIGFWNGKIYGYWRKYIYLDNQIHYLTQEKYDHLTEYMAYITQKKELL